MPWWYWFRCKMGYPVFTVLNGYHGRHGPNSIVVCLGCGKEKWTH